MLRIRLSNSIGALLGALLIASCSDMGSTGLTAPTEVAASHSSGPLSVPAIAGSVTDAAGLELRAIWWDKQYKNVVRVSKTISPAGGTISIPETGLTMSFPAGAVASPITITVTADAKYVAYKMEPSGTQFLKDVTVTQSLETTSIFGRALKSQLYAAYIADDNVKLSGKVPVLEIEPSTTIFSVLSGLLPKSQVWTIRHFSRYMLASG
ncbi:MAG: hypothetical protein ABI469_02535 [Gemmatimonadales bacterium]